MESIIIGIDISKKTLDICVKKANTINYYVIANEVREIKKFFKAYRQEKLVIAMENTGRYNWNLFEVLEGFEFKVYMLSALHLKNSLRFTRGKQDKIDALRICNFIEKHQEQTKQWRPCPVPVKKIKVLLAERLLRIKIRKQLRTQQHDYKLMKGLSLDKQLTKLNSHMLEQLNGQIQALEDEIQNVIAGDKTLSQQQQLMLSIPGVGKVLTWMIMAKTEGFTTITEPRKMACYSGVVPFDHQSGTSVRRRPRVSSLADKTLKSVLHMAAMTAVRPNNELGIYYLRKVNEGKNKMSVLNAVRNKLIHRIFAVIRTQIPYQKHLAVS